MKIFDDLNTVVPFREANKFNEKLNLTGIIIAGRESISRHYFFKFKKVLSVKL